MPSIIERLKALLGSPKDKGGARPAPAPGRPGGRPPRPPPPKQPPPAASAPAARRLPLPQPQPGRGELDRLRQQYGELAQRLAGLPSHAPEGARGQLLEKLGAASPHSRTPDAPHGVASRSSSDEELGPGAQRRPRGPGTLREHGKADTLSKLTKLARQRHGRAQQGRRGSDGAQEEAGLGLHPAQQPAAETPPQPQQEEEQQAVSPAAEEEAAPPQPERSFRTPGCV